MKEYQYTVNDYSHNFGSVWCSLKVDSWTKRNELSQDTGLDLRTLSATISQMRQAGYPIVSKRTHGYKIARTVEEIEANIEWLRDTLEAYQLTIDTLEKLKKGEFKK